MTCRTWIASIAASVALLLMGCADAPDGRGGVIEVFNAGSLARPMRAALDTFAARNDLRIHQENTGSLEAARKLLDLHKIPDVIALADYEVFPTMLMPEHVGWYMDIARNRMVIAYTDKSRLASELSVGTWVSVLQRPGVEVGRADPALDPAGYRALLMYDLAEIHYGDPGLSARLLAAAPERNVRSKAADLVALVQAGELDYMIGYESVAKATGLRYLNLPPEIDLGSPDHASAYARVSVRVPLTTQADSITFRGQPIMYALSIPRAARRPNLAVGFVQFLISPEGRAILRNAQLDVLDAPRLHGADIPREIADAVASAGGVQAGSTTR